MRSPLARIAPLAAAVAAAFGCSELPTHLASHVQGQVQVRGSGPMTKEARRTSAFRRIQVSGAFEVEVRRGSPSVTVEAQKSLLRYIKTDVVSGELVVGTDASMNADKPMRVRITTNDLTAIEISGACSLKSDAYRADQFRLNASGASRVTLPITARSLEAELTGASEVKLSGSTERLDLELTGASKLRADDLRVERAKVEVSGASELNLRVAKELKGDVSGAATVRYRGNPRVDVETSGASTVARG
jgi:hypothetical protein